MVQEGGQQVPFIRADPGSITFESSPADVPVPAPPKPSDPVAPLPAPASKTGIPPPISSEVSPINAEMGPGQPVARLELIPPEQRKMMATTPEKSVTNSTSVNPLNTVADEPFGMDEIETKEGQVKLHKLAKSGRLNMMNKGMAQTLKAMKSSYDFMPKDRPPTDYKGLLKDYMKLQADFSRHLGMTTSKLQAPQPSAPVTNPQIQRALGAIVPVSALPPGTVPAGTPMVNQQGVRDVLMTPPPVQQIEEQMIPEKQQTDYKKIISPSASFKINTYKKEVQTKKVQAGGIALVSHASQYRRLN